MPTTIPPIEFVRLELDALRKRIEDLEHEPLAEKNSAVYKIYYQVKLDKGYHDWWITCSSPVQALKAFSEWNTGIRNVSIHKQVICGTGDSLHKMEEQL